MNNSNLVKSSRIIDRFFRILQGFMIAFALVSFVFIVLSFVIGKKIIQDASFVEFGKLTVYLTESAIPDYSELHKAILFKLTAVIVGVSAGWYLLHVIRQIMKPMKDGRPFDYGIAFQIRKLAWTSLIGGAIIEGCRVLSSIAEIKAYDMERLLNSDAAERFSYNYSPDISFVVIAALLLFLSVIFRYGVGLQKESDETL